MRRPIPRLPGFYSHGRNTAPRGADPTAWNYTRQGYRLIRMETAHPGYIEDKEDLKKRLRRVAGQVNGIERMVEEERYCIDILTQISAIRSALDRVAIAVLDDHARHCVVDAAAGQRDERTTEMMDAVARLLKSR